MVIRFICPNGHPLSAPDDRAGTMGKCPKCQTAFVVPDLEDNGETDEPHPGSGDATAIGDPASGIRSSPSAPSGSRVSSGSGTSLPSQETIVFLCPNGHRLNGPAALKGRPGQCPHCGARFVIPGDDEEEEPEADASDDQPAAGPQSLAGEPPTSQPVVRPAAAPFTGPPLPPQPTSSHSDGPHPAGPISAGEAEFDDDVEVVDDAELLDEFSAEDEFGQELLETSHPLGDLIERLYDQTDTNSWLQLYLKDGQSIRVDRFSGPLSQGPYAVFRELAQGNSGAPTEVVIIAWDEIRRVTVHRPDATHEAWFERGQR